VNLTKSFALHEFIVSEYAVRNGIKNLPSEQYISALEQLCKQVLQPLRDHLMRPVVITSGYRSPELNTAIRGSYRSQHCKGEAADLFVPGMAIDRVVDVIRSMHLPFDQLINEFDSWVHVSHRVKGPQRGEVLQARKYGNRTIFEPF